MPNVLFVCTANQCRSPMAAALYLRQLNRRNLTLQVDWRVSSAGSWAKEGLPAIPNAVRVMREMGLHIEQHRSRQVSAELLKPFDLILVMSQHQQEGLRVEFSHLAERIYLLGEMAGPKYDIPDPAGGKIDEVREIAQEMDQLLDRGFARILERLGVFFQKTS